ncbi:MAG: divergent polysaccharide deacetylase family protein [Candidatus Aquilonibacter sp.]
MSKRRSQRRPFGGWPALLVLFIIACVAGWYLLRPIPRNGATAPSQPPVAQTSTQTPAAAAPSETASPSPSSAASATPTLTPNPRAPKIALIVDDCGQWVDIERGYIALPIPLTLSVLPHVHAGMQIAKEAQAAGKGVMLHLPMEPLSGIYPGPGEVKTSMSDAQIIAQVQDDLAQVPLAQGVNNHEGSKASADPRVMRDVMQVLSQHGGLFFIDSRTNAASVGAQEATAAGIPTASRDVFLDNREDVNYTEGQLREAAAIAQRTGSAIAIGHPRATTLEAVRAMIPQLQAQGITFVLVSSLTH